MKPHLTFHKPHEAHETGRILAYCHKAYIGRINPLGDGRATWELDRTDERGTARSVQAAQIALAEAFGRWVVSAGLAAPVGDRIIAAKWEWTDGKYKGSTFWACHDPVADGRPDAWIKIGARPLGAAYVYVQVGEGLDLLKDLNAFRSVHP